MILSRVRACRVWTEGEFGDGTDGRVWAAMAKGRKPQKRIKSINAYLDSFFFEWTRNSQETLSKIIVESFPRLNHTTFLNLTPVSRRVKKPDLVHVYDLNIVVLTGVFFFNPYKIENTLNSNVLISPHSFSTVPLSYFW